ncbi:MAG: phosphoenolpyruvate--protein phosphotransferase [Phycisphaerales bacterium]|jgi:phosphoenolpyruvate-protein phosphotransferase (PTS system enzyme I)|nr:phosphoenolpyruvate--protein phosphotransferase [Phycisphaerales bacterium]
MKTKEGIGVSPGVAIAPAAIVDAEEFDIPERHVAPELSGREINRLEKAVEISQNEILDLRKSTSEQIGKEIASIFDFHLGLLKDTTLLKKFTDAINDDHVTSEYAVAAVLRAYAKEFLDMPQYLADRVKDVYDIEKRLLRNLVGQSRQALKHLESDRILLAHDLTPSQTAGMDREHVLGLAIDAGGQTSHTAIVAKALGIPAVVGLNSVTGEATAGDMVIIDGHRGTVIIDPDEKTLAHYRVLAKQQVEFIHSLDSLKDLPAVTLDGHEINLLGNIEFPAEAASVINKGGTGIGLYRTEFLYLGAESEPTEEDHYNAYKEVIDLCKGRPIVVRTLDLGADKQTQSRARTPERNPFLGCRSIRFCLQELPMFKTQIRALLRASVDADVRMMFPLITNLRELRQAKAIVRDVAEDLEEDGIEHRHDIPLGMMIETPSAALQCNAFAQEVDFFSIGTNDLIQYTLAVDRANEKVAPLFTAAHPAILRLIKEVIRAGQRYEVPVSLCGEMGGDVVFTMLLMGLGVTTFSCTPPAIPEIKQLIRSVTMEQAAKVARRVMTFDGDQEILNYIRVATRKVLPDAYTNF